MNSDDSNLKYATAEFLELLIIRGILLSKSNYAEIAGPAINRGFEVEFEGRIGRTSLREAIEEAAALAHGEVFDVLAAEFLTFVERTDVEEKPGWLLHEIRETLHALLANPSCKENAGELAEALRRVNRAQRARSRGDEGE